MTPIAFSRSFFVSIFGGLFSLMTISSCAPLVFFGAGSSVTTSAAEERGLGGVMSDASIKTTISTAFIEYEGNLFSEVSVDVHRGKVLLTGVVKTAHEKTAAVNCVWTVHGIKEVIDAIEVAKGENFGDYASDSWITTQLSSKLLFDEAIKSINYKVTTFHGVVYVLGVAQNQTELEAVLNHARNLSGVKKVVSYADVKSAPQIHKEVPDRMNVGEEAHTRGQELSPPPSHTDIVSDESREQAPEDSQDNPPDNPSENSQDTPASFDNDRPIMATPL